MQTNMFTQIIFAEIDRLQEPMTTFLQRLVQFEFARAGAGGAPLHCPKAA